MKKIMLAFNGADYPSHVLELALSIARQSASTLHALFVYPQHADASLQYPFPNDLSFTHPGVDEQDQEEADLRLVEANIQVFKDECRESGVACKVDHPGLVSLDELIRYSEYADLIIADRKDELGRYSLSDLLVDALCPVVLVPRLWQAPERIIFSFDGSPSSIYAIKLFSYLFPEWKDKPAYLFSINPDEETEKRIESEVTDWLRTHFTDLKVHIAVGRVQEELLHFIREESDKSVIVMGAYGRTGFSRLVHQSLSQVVMEQTQATLFMAHK